MLGYMLGYTMCKMNIIKIILFCGKFFHGVYLRTVLHSNFDFSSGLNLQNRREGSGEISLRYFSTLRGL